MNTILWSPLDFSSIGATTKFTANKFWVPTVIEESLREAGFVTVSWSDFCLSCTIEGKGGQGPETGCCLA